MNENRINPRFKTIGQAYIAGIIDKGLLLKNISITGCCLKSTVKTDKIKIGENYTIKIKSRNFFKNYEFDIKAECKWLRKASAYGEIGFNITVSPTGKNFQNYVDFITAHSTLI